MTLILALFYWLKPSTVAVQGSLWGISVSPWYDSTWEAERERVIHVSAALETDVLPGAGIARWWCVGLAVLLDAVSWVRSSSGENLSGRGDFSLGPPPMPLKKNPSFG